MRNTSIRAYKNLGFGLLTALLVVVALITFLSYVYEGAATQNTAILFAMRHHLGIMVALLLVAIAFGFAWASFTFAELERRQKDSRTMLDVVLLFLAPEERQLLNYLVAKAGKATQADVARLPGFGRVKAHRLVRRMEEKSLITVESHGKVRHVALKDNILNALLE